MSTNTVIASQIDTQHQLLMKTLVTFYQNQSHVQQMMRIINGESRISLRIVDWFVTNYAKKFYTVYNLFRASSREPDTLFPVRFKVHNEYKLKLKAYSKKRFDPFCRHDRISIPYDDTMCIETTIGQLNFFKWAIEHKIMEHIDENYEEIERDMNERNSTSRRRIMLAVSNDAPGINATPEKTRKKREELSISACRSIKKEIVKIVVKFEL